MSTPVTPQPPHLVVQEHRRPGKGTAATMTLPRAQPRDSPPRSPRRLTPGTLAAKCEQGRSRHEILVFPVGLILSVGEPEAALYPPRQTLTPPP